VKSPPIESPIRRWREEAGLTQAELAQATGISTTTIIWNELLLYPEPSSRIISVFQYGSRVKPYSPPVGPLGNFQNYVDEYLAAQRHHRKLSDWSSDPKVLDVFKTRKWLKTLSQQALVSDYEDEHSQYHERIFQEMTNELEWEKAGFPDRRKKNRRKVDKNRMVLAKVLLWAGLILTLVFVGLSLYILSKNGDYL
jgi:hypothetical protein